MVLAVWQKVSDFFDQDGFERALKILRSARHSVYVLHVVDRAEAEPSLRGDVRLVDRERGSELEVTVTDGLLERYRAAFEDLRARVERSCRAQEIGYCVARTEVPFDELVLTVLRRGGLVG